MAKKFKDEDGVWKTLPNGVHIFIRNGESLSSAMSRAGIRVDGLKQFKVGKNGIEKADISKNDNKVVHKGLKDSVGGSLETKEAWLEKVGIYNASEEERNAIYRDEEHNKKVEKQRDIEEARRLYAKAAKNGDDSYAQHLYEYLSANDAAPDDLLPSNNFEEYKPSTSYTSPKDITNEKDRQHLQKLADMMSEQLETKDGSSDFKLEKTYFDYGQDWTYTSINNGYQVLTPHLWKEYMQGNMSAQEVIDEVVKDQKTLLHRKNAAQQPLNKVGKEYQRDPYSGRKQTVAKNGIATKDHWETDSEGNRQFIKKGEMTLAKQAEERINLKPMTDEEKSIKEAYRKRDTYNFTDEQREKLSKLMKRIDFDDDLYKNGHMVRIKPEYLDDYEDPNDLYYVVEDSGDMLTVSNFTQNKDRWNKSFAEGGGFISQNTWAKYMFEDAKTDINEINKQHVNKILDKVGVNNNDIKDKYSTATSKNFDTHGYDIKDIKKVSDKYGLSFASALAVIEEEKMFKKRKK